MSSASSMPISGHLKELRRRLVFSLMVIAVSMILVLTQYPLVLGVLSAPIKGFIPDPHLLYAHTFFEGFFTQLKVSFILSLTLTFPIHLISIVSFVFPALSKKEKRIAWLSLFFGSLLATAGMVFSYTQLLPNSLQFLTSETFLPSQIGVLLNYNQNIAYILNFLVGIAVGFQFPILLLISLYFKIVSLKTLVRSSRYIIIGIFIMSAIITPPDIVSQVGLALPLIVLYGLTLLIAWIFRLGR